jgi:hypothetical protein
VAAVAERCGAIDISVDIAGVSLPVSLDDDAWKDGEAWTLAGVSTERHG